MPPAGSRLVHGMSSTSATALVLAQGLIEGCAFGKSSHLDARVDAATREASRINLVGAHSAFPVSNLAMQVVELHEVAIHHAQSANSRCCQIYDNRAAQFRPPQSPEWRSCRGETVLAQSMPCFASCGFTAILPSSFIVDKSQCMNSGRRCSHDNLILCSCRQCLAPS